MRCRRGRGNPFHRTGNEVRDHGINRNPRPEMKTPVWPVRPKNPHQGHGPACLSRARVRCISCQPSNPCPRSAGAGPSAWCLSRCQSADPNGGHRATAGRAVLRPHESPALTQPGMQAAGDIHPGLDGRHNIGGPMVRQHTPALATPTIRVFAPLATASAIVSSGMCKSACSRASGAGQGTILAANPRCHARFRCELIGNITEEHEIRRFHQHGRAPSLGMPLYPSAGGRGQCRFSNCPERKPRDCPAAAVSTRLTCPRGWIFDAFFA